MGIKVVVADDHPAVVTGLRCLLGRAAGINLVGTARNSTEVVALLSASLCDVLVTDYVMPGGEFGDGLPYLAFLRRRFPRLRLVVFTILDNVAITRSSEAIGVEAVVSKGDCFNDLLRVLYGRPAAKATDRAPGRTSSTDHFVAESTVDVDALLGVLSKHELEVLRRFVSGDSISNIAARLHRTRQTVSSQKISAMLKLGIARDADLFRFAFENGLIDHGRQAAKSSSGKFQ